MLKIENKKPVVYKESKTMGNLIIKEVSKEIAKDLCVRFHYAHRWSDYNTYFGMVNIGIFKEKEPEKCLGVAVFGHMMNSNSYKNISDDITKDEILELNRLWIDDCLGRNAESILLSGSWTIMRYYGKVKVIQSFADGRLGCGTVYKASNFKYYGYQDSIFFMNKDTKETYFDSSFHNTRIPKLMCKLSTLYVQNKLEVFSPKSYRYIYLIDKNVNIKLEEQEFPPYEMSSNKLEYDYIYQREIPAIFRSYLISKVLDINMDSSYYLSNYLLEHFDEDMINETLNKQIKNDMLIRKIGHYKEFNYIKDINDWIPLLKSDMSTKKHTLCIESLW